MIRGVFFDLGGVVFDSPFEAIDRFEVEQKVVPGTVTETIRSGGRSGPWGRLERGEISIDTFGAEFETLIGVDGRRLLELIGSTMVVRPAMVQEIRRLGAAGFTLVAVTNNWSPMDVAELDGLFDHVVESVKEGYHKPDVELFQIALDRAALPANQVVMLDDIGRNLKAAGGLGMATIKVGDPQEAIAELSDLLATG